MSQIEKRKRSPNWLASEKHLLLDIIEKHFSVIENKKTDAVTMKQKTAEWVTMSHEYNSQTMQCLRTAENLKAQWESMKKAVKKESSNIRMHMIQTGGGPPKPKTEDPFYNRILSLIQPSVVGLYNSFDSDASVSQSIEVQESQSEVAHVGVIEVIEVEPPVSVCTPVPAPDVEPDWGNCLPVVSKAPVSGNVIEDEPAVPFCTPIPAPVKEPDWGNYTPVLLKTPVSKNLKETGYIKKGISKRHPILPASSVDLLNNKKIEAIIAQREHADAERREANSMFNIMMQIKEQELIIKKEEAKQSKLKTRLLLLELRNKKKAESLE